MSSAKLLNAMRLQAQRALSEHTTTRVALIHNYNPNEYVARATLQPDDVQTGYLPIAAAWVGNGWGMFSPPPENALGLVAFPEGNINAGIILGCFWNDVDRPLAVPSGEFWLVHQTGSCIKFHNDGSVELDANTNLTVTVGGNLTANVTGNADLTAESATVNGNTQINGNLVVSGSIQDQNGAKGTMQHIRDVYDGHTHPNVQSGSSPTPPPTQQL